MKNLLVKVRIQVPWSLLLPSLRSLRQVCDSQSIWRLPLVWAFLCRRVGVLGPQSSAAGYPRSRRSKRKLSSIKEMKTQKKTTQSEIKKHPWRPCPLGKYWVSAHDRHRTSSRGIAYIQSVRGYCRTNPSHKDHLYRNDIQEIAKRHFKQFDKVPLKPINEFKGKDAKYDSMIQGWTKLWLPRSLDSIRKFGIINMGKNQLLV